MLAIAQIPIADRNKDRIDRKVLREAVECRRESGDGGNGHESGALQHANRLGERRCAIGGSREVIEGSHHKHDIETFRFVRQASGVANAQCGNRMTCHRTSPTRFVHEPRRRVDQVNLVSKLREP